MSQHTKLQVQLFEMHCFTMFITPLCVDFPLKIVSLILLGDFYSWPLALSN